jgi:hypothetical protein
MGLQTRLLLFHQAQTTTPPSNNSRSAVSGQTILVNSEPNARKRIPFSNKTPNINNTSSLSTKVISADSVEFEDFLGNEFRKETLKSQSEPVNLLKVQNRVKTVSIDELPGRKDDFQITARFLARILKHETLIEEELGSNCDDLVKLFAFLEREGKLSHKVLALFSKLSSGIRSISMTQSYGAPENDLGLRSAPRFPISKCTKSFYSGFNAVQVLDFTNVPLPDDELRFLIKLSKVQALGLSGSKVTCKGIKYLTQHASFKSNLKCLKMCFVDGVDDSLFSLLPLFPRLQEVDLRGCSGLTLNGALQLIPEGRKLFFSFKIIEWPESIAVQLSEKHTFYQDLKKAKPDLILDPKDISIPFLDETELKRQLKWHKQVYTDIYLNLNLEALRAKFVFILRLRRREQILYEVSVD